jgi:outer membrane receptor protein involved in Fe transport
MRCSSSYIVSRRAWFGSIAVLLILAATGFAQLSPDPDALSLQDLLHAKVYTASKYQQKEAEAPSTVSVITAEDIRHYGYRTLQEALQSVTGIYVKNHLSYSTLGVRGFAPTGDANGRMLFLVNGHAINNNIDDSAPIGDDFPIDMDLIERIEVVRGPSASLYGADAFMGVVNVITKTGKSQGEVISGEAGSLGTHKTTAIYGFDRGGTQAMFSASYWDSNAPGQLDTIEDPIGSPSSRNQTRRAMALVSSHGFTLQTVASIAEDKVPTSSQWCGSCHQTDTHATNFHGYADLQYEHRIWKSTQLIARTYYDNYASHGTYNDLRGCSSATCHGSLYDYDSAHGERVGQELKLTRVFLDKHRVTVGAEYRENFHQAQQNYILYNIPVQSRTFVNYDRTSGIWGIYAAGEFHLLPKVILNAGLRNDRYNYLFGSKTSPRAALIYTPRRSTTLKFLYGTAFRVPSFSELYYQGMASVSAPNLRPETTRTFEGDWEQQLGRRMTLSAAVFFNNIGSYIEEQTTVINSNIDQTTYSNSKATAKGGELELKDRLPSGIEGRLSYTYQDARDQLTGAALPDAPKHLVEVNIAAPLFRRMLTPAIQAEYMSKSATVWPAIGDSSPPVLVNVNFSSREFWGGFSASGGVYNLVGRSMSERTFGYFEQTHAISSTSLLPDDRRSFRVKLTWTSGERSDKDKEDEPHPAGIE